MNFETKMADVPLETKIEADVPIRVQLRDLKWGECEVRISRTVTSMSLWRQVHVKVREGVHRTLFLLQEQIKSEIDASGHSQGHGEGGSE